MSIIIQKKLLKKGYFPDEVGYWFSTKTLSENYTKILNYAQYDRKKISKSLKYSIPKGKFHRRNLEISNPYNFLFLTKEIHDNWKDISTHLEKSKLSLTTPVFLANKHRAISRKHSFEDITTMFITSAVGANYVLKTDISRFYSTIYTHSIPWALHTKLVSKNKKTDTTLLGNRLDKLIRDSQDGQTIGIPIGPDTSLIIAEIIGVAIDEELIKDIECLSAFRYIDDYFIFF